MAFNSLCYPCEQSMVTAMRLFEAMPSLSVEDVVSRIFPSSSESGMLEGEALALHGEEHERQLLPRALPQLEKAPRSGEHALRKE